MTDAERDLLLLEIRDNTREIMQRLLAVERSAKPAQAVSDKATTLLLSAIAATIGDKVFTCADLLEHAALKPALHAALAGMNAKQLGRLLSRSEGRSIGGLSVHRVRADSHGTEWMVKAV